MAGGEIGRLAEVWSEFGQRTGQWNECADFHRTLGCSQANRREFDQACAYRHTQPLEECASVKGSFGVLYHNLSCHHHPPLQGVQGASFKAQGSKLLVWVATSNLEHCPF